MIMSVSPNWLLNIVAIKIKEIKKPIRAISINAYKSLDVAEFAGAVRL